MRLIKIYIAISVACLIFPLITLAGVGRVATIDDIRLLKEDLLSGKIKIGKTRLKNVREMYGDATSITESDRRITYDYGDLRIAFDKKKIWKKWEYDTFKDPVYTDDVDDLRFDLESEELVGNNITYERVRKDYDEPTDSKETYNDGEMSIYYYGDIKMIFENVYTVRSWRGDKLRKTTVSKGVLSGN